MDMVALAARCCVVATGVALALTGLVVLVREHSLARPARIEVDLGPLALANYVGIGGYATLGPIVAIWASPSGDGDVPRTAMEVAGIAFLALATGIEAWSIRVMGRNLVSEAEVRADTELVTSGPFGVVRHPLYVSIVLLWAGGAAALQSPLLAAGLLLLVPALYLRARLEEKMLARHFGDIYREYAAGVPMFVPRLHR